MASAAPGPAIRPADPAALCYRAPVLRLAQGRRVAALLAMALLAAPAPSPAADAAPAPSPTPTPAAPPPAEETPRFPPPSWTGPADVPVGDPMEASTDLVEVVSRGIGLYS